MPRIKQKQSRRPKRSRFQILNLGRTINAWRRTVISMATLLVFGWVVWQDYMPLMWEATQDQIHALARSAGFRLQHVTCDGLEKTPERDVLDRLGVAPGESLFKLDMAAAREEIEKLPWVHTAMLFRRLPDQLVVRISERHPAALWQKNKKLYLIDEYGAVIGHLSSAHYAHLMVVVGEEAPAATSALLEQLSAFPKLAEKVRSAVNHGGRRWDIILKSDVTVKLPEGDIAHALAHLERMDQDHDLTKGDIRVIDMRLKDRSFFYMSGKNKKFDNKSGRIA